jgi:Lrp/AsnC family transcriptional regulator, leucine-responsive regulatory protein
MDTLDHKILEILNGDARTPYAQMARELGISQPTVADRIRRLETSGVVRGALLLVDHASLGFTVGAFVRLRAKIAHKQKLIETARAMPQVIEMYSVTGDDCMIVRVCARSVEELAEILQRLTTLAESSTSVVLETLISPRNPIVTRLPAVARETPSNQAMPKEPGRRRQMR